MEVNEKQFTNIFMAIESVLFAYLELCKRTAFLCYWYVMLLAVLQENNFCLSIRVKIASYSTYEAKRTWRYQKKATIKHIAQLSRCIKDKQKKGGGGMLD